jgi:hypothetical protein
MTAAGKAARSSCPACTASRYVKRKASVDYMSRLDSFHPPS